MPVAFWFKTRMSVVWLDYSRPYRSDLLRLLAVGWLCGLWRREAVTPVQLQTQLTEHCGCPAPQPLPEVAISLWTLLLALGAAALAGLIVGAALGGAVATLSIRFGQPVPDGRATRKVRGAVTPSQLRELREE